MNYQKYECVICGYIYDEELGDPEDGIPAGTKWEDIPDDWVLATGETHTVKEFVELAFKRVNLDSSEYVEVSDKYFRPNEVNYLLGDSSKAQKGLNWSPKTSFEDLVSMMVDSDLKLAEQEKVLLDKGLIHPSWENYKK